MAKATQTSIITDQKYLGKEPEFDGSEMTQTQLIVALNWYNYFKNVDDAKIYLNNYATANKIKLNMAMHTTNTFGWIARMIARGAGIDQVTKDKFDSYINKLKKPAKVIKIVPTEARVINRLDAWMPDFEDAFDAFTEPFDCYNYLVSRNVPQMYVKQISDYYEEILVEANAAYDKSDKELTETYKHYTRTQQKARITFLKGIIMDCGKLLDNVKKERKPRKKREKSVGSLLKHFKHCVHDPILKISSESPDKIIGASSLYVYNVKYKMLAVFHALDDNGLTVNRTAIANYDPKKSVIKRIGRKTEETINEILNGTKRSRIRVIDKVKAEPAAFTDRLNENSLILKVDK